MAEGQRLWRQADEYYESMKRLQTQVTKLGKDIRPWAPLDEKKKSWDLEDQLQQATQNWQYTHDLAADATLAAFEFMPHFGPARRQLAEMYIQISQHFEQLGRTTAAAYHWTRVALFDDGTYAAIIKGDGALTLETSPPGADVSCYRYVEKDRVLIPAEEQALGKTPLKDVSIPMGSYLLILKKAGFRDTRYPIYISRQHRWITEQPANLYTDEEIGADFCYVPAGSFIFGGDSEAPGSGPKQVRDLSEFAIGQENVLGLNYLEFINILQLQNAEEAAARAPRRMDGSSEVIQDKNGVWKFPPHDHEQISFTARRPLSGISWHDAQAYAHWVGQRHRAEIRLPTQEEREKAARGVDGRFFSWGNQPEFSFANMRLSRPQAAPSEAGEFPHDRSPYNVWDVCGNMSNWTSSGVGGLRFIAGGNWSGTSGTARLAHCGRFAPEVASNWIGCRLLKELPGSRSHAKPKK